MKDKKISWISKYIVGEKYIELGLKFWESPNFFFLIMGSITAASMVIAYIIIARYQSPELASGVVFAIAIIFLSIRSLLIRSVERVLDKEKVKNEFISIASHQLRTPLTGLRWTIEELAGSSENLTEEQRNNLTVIQTTNHRMIRLVNDLLFVSRIDSKRFAVNVKTFDLCALVNEIIEDLSPHAKARNVKVSSTVPEHCHLSVDPEKIKIAIQNLTDNAIKYNNRESDKKVTISVKESSTRLVVNVWDNGNLIPASQQKKLFEKFYRPTSSQSKETDGSGLGLYITRAIVEAHDGHISLNSSSKGNTFTIDLPYKN